MRNVFLFLFLSAALSSGVRAEDAPKFRIRWYVAHNFSNRRIFKPIESFGRRMKEQSHGEIAVTFEMPQDKTLGDTNYHRTALEKIYQDELEMSQIAISVMDRFSPEMDILDFPFLFRDHAHAAAVLDGPIGAKIMKSFFDGSDGKIRGLAYTYSGGYRQFLTTREIRRLEDFSRLKMFDSNHRMGQELLASWGVQFSADPSGSQLDKVAQGLRKGAINAEDGEYTRLEVVEKLMGPGEGGPRFLLETDHSLFLTGILVNEKFFQTLPEKYRELLVAEVKKMALEERLVSIEEAKVVKKALRSRGVRFMKLAKPEQSRLEQASQALYQKYQAKLGGVIAEIRASK